MNPQKLISTISCVLEYTDNQLLERLMLLLKIKDKINKRVTTKKKISSVIMLTEISYYDRVCDMIAKRGIYTLFDFLSSENAQWSINA